MRELSFEEIEEVSGGHYAHQQVDWLSFSTGVACLIGGAISPGPVSTTAGILGGTALIGSSTGWW